MNRQDTVFLRFIAICLVLNSHLDLYYPIAYLGSGGAIGNALFFMLSSFGLFLSEAKKPQSVLVYLTKRIRRIYPPIWVVLIFLVLPIQVLHYPIDTEKVIVFISEFIYPHFWFIKALLFYYLIGFFIIKNYTQRKNILVMALAFVVYLFVSLTHLDLSSFSVEKMPFKVFFYVLVFLFGILLSSINARIKFRGPIDVIICFTLIVVFYGAKYLMVKYMFFNVQILQQLILLLVVFYALKISRSPVVRERIMLLPGVGYLIRYISLITLELYIVHVTISPIILNRKLPFPYNAIVFLCLTFVISIIVRWTASKINNSNILKFHGI
jgi:peptidoglycan/LPS O-acetylase OafA/YrhL